MPPNCQKTGGLVLHQIFKAMRLFESKIQKRLTEASTDEQILKAINKKRDFEDEKKNSDDKNYNVETYIFETIDMLWDDKQFDEAKRVWKKVDAIDKTLGSKLKIAYEF